MKFSSLKSFTSAVALTGAMTLGQMGSAQAEDNNSGLAGFSEQQGQMADISAPLSAAKVKARRDAFGASQGKIVLHASRERLEGAASMARVFNELGYPTAVFLGGPEGEIEAFVDRAVAGKFSKRQLDDGTLAGIVTIIFDERLGQPRAASLALSQ